MQAFRNFIDAIFYPFRMIARLPSQVISSPRRMLGLSLPVRAALILGLCLVIILVIWTIVILSMQGLTQSKPYLWGELPYLIALAIAIPIVVGIALKLWLEGEPSPFPEIESVWNAAQEAMTQQGIEANATPIFLVLGLSGDDDNDRFFAGIETSLPVRVPGGGGPIRVMAGPDAIYISCTDASCLSQCIAAGDSVAGVPAVAPAGGAPLSTTMVLGDTPAATAPAPPTSPAGAFPVGQAPLSPVPAVTPPAMGATIQIPDMPGAGSPVAAMVTPATAAPVQRMDPAAVQRASARLAYLCHCIRKRRDPLAPINGVLVSTPFRLLVESRGDQVSQLQVALVNDLATIRSSIRMRCGVTHVVTGMHEENGFCELIRRVGSERIASQRFGKGFGLWNTASEGQLKALVSHACGAFEDWCYHLFRSGGAIDERGNRQLYRLLCRVRSQLRPRLRDLVQNAYLVRPQGTDLTQEEPLLFAGCYFAANGPTPDLQAFLPSVFVKMRSQEEDLEWGREALAEERRSQAVVQVLMVLNGILIAGIVGMFVYSQM
ncbi:MAG: type VI secretion protein IcmF/TssM N-terminal domain-containing protein [Planctomycetota bacterium]